MSFLKNRTRAISLVDQPPGQQQMAASWISNLLPNGKGDSADSAENSPVSTPVHLPVQQHSASFGSHKSVNLLSEAPQHGRKLSDREQRDCEVIGMWLIYR